MKYEVLNDFIEKEHENTLYKKTGTYPAEGFKTTATRVKYLQGTNNPYKKAFLGKEIKETTKRATTKKE